MVYQLKPKRLRVLWPSKYRNDTFFISVTDSLDEDGITGYADIKDIKVFIYFIFYYNKNELRKSFIVLEPIWKFNALNLPVSFIEVEMLT